MIDKLSAEDACLLTETLALIPEQDEIQMDSRDRKRLRQPTSEVTPEGLFLWHLSEHQVFEEETDPALRKQGVRLRPVGVHPEGRLSETEIAAEEARLGVALPQPWRVIYRHFNGGWNNTLHWGDPEDPRDTEPLALISRSESLPLQEVAPLRDLMAPDRPELDLSPIDPRLIAIGYHQSEAMLLDYRAGPDPRVGHAYIDEFSDDPLPTWEEEAFWWPNMRVYFAGLYQQDRAV
ncbi:SMI1/KNR4 family protein [Vannielia litorea]|uniref:SMI1/KNR4 family protein n=1 Tax=Vannielia litorea TaxID=1217970 RepID=UPI001C981AAB|nr:SMI1/KNR4 family protein [Vannielia litorea]MBY6049597.1 SMI1/KNR4 family protein [Vannielia litorea]MBY6077011.1 SMI1/KNR4 family protein [Vannielia litorea]